MRGGIRARDRRGAVAGAALVGLSVCLSWAIASAVPGPPTNDEMAMVVLANRARANPAAVGSAWPPSAPLSWNDGLGAAARFHSDELADATSAGQSCPAHDSCDGTAWWRRIKRYYPDYVLIAEEVTVSAHDPERLHNTFMVATDHRDDILNGVFDEVGVGIADFTSFFGPGADATIDLGTRGFIANQSRPTLPAGCILPRSGSASTPRKLMVNYYHFRGGAPQTVRARLGSSCVALALDEGSPEHGTYQAIRTVSGSGCVPLVFEAIRSDGEHFFWPEGEAIAVAVGGANCPERTSTMPTADCGGGPVPVGTPTPVPAPTPAPGLDHAKAVLRPGRTSPTVGKVQVTGVIDLPAGFDPASSLSISVDLPGGRWSVALPASCGGVPCLKANRRSTGLNGSYGSGRKLTLTQKGGRWALRFFDPSETLPTLGPGPATITVVVAGTTNAAAVTGSIREGALVAN